MGMRVGWCGEGWKAPLTFVVACASSLTAGCGPKPAQLSSSMAFLKLAAVTTYTQEPGKTEPTRYVNVFVDGRWHLTGEDGSARFRLEPGRHVVRFRAIGFEVAADTGGL